MWHQPVWSIAAGCFSSAVTVIDFLLHKPPQHWFLMLFNGPDNPQNCPLHDESRPPSNTWLFKCTRVSVPNGTSIGSPIFAGMNVTNRQTDYATPLVEIGRILCTEFMRYGLIIGVYSCHCLTWLLMTTFLLCDASWWQFFSNIMLMSYVTDNPWFTYKMAIKIDMLWHFALRLLVDQQK